MLCIDKKQLFATRYSNYSREYQAAQAQVCTKKHELPSDRIKPVRYAIISRVEHGIIKNKAEKGDFFA